MIDLRRLQVPDFDDRHDRLVAADMDRKGRIACVLERDGARRLMIDGNESTAIPDEARQHIWSVRWVGDDVIVDPVLDISDDAINACAIVGRSSYEQVPFGVPYALHVGGPYVFISYSERPLLFARDLSHEDDVVTVFSAETKARLLGMSDIMPHMREDPDCYEVISGCAAFDGVFVFVGLGSSGLWTLDPDKRACRAVLPEPLLASPEDVEALSTDGPFAVLMSVEEHGIRLRWVHRETGVTERWEFLGASAIEASVGVFAEPRPSRGWRLSADVRGLDSGRFLLRTVQRLVLLTTG